MNRTTQTLAAICCGMLITFVACKKSARTTSCTSTLHAYTGPDTMMSGVHGFTYSCSHGVVNLTTGAIAAAGTFSGTLLFTTQATFNTSDNCYYLFSDSAGLGGAIPNYKLYKIDAGGTLTTMTPPDTSRYTSIAYNSVTGKLYCQTRSSLAQITPGTSSYSVTALAAPIHPFAPELFSPGNITVDNTTGDMFLTTITGSGPSATYYIEKYHPGSSSTTVVASGPGGLGIFELRFNKNDNKLYALQLNTDTLTYDFIRVDPTAGTITSISGLGPLVNPDMYSATLDPCSNNYILSTDVGGGVPFGKFVLFQLNMSGAIVQHDTTTTLYQGLHVAY